MLTFLGRLFGTPRPDLAPEPRDGMNSSDSRGAGEGAPRASDRYFATMMALQDAVSRRDFERAAAFVRENLSYIPDWVRESAHDYGSFDIGSIPGLQQGGTVLALVDDEEGLARLRDVITSVPELARWGDDADRHQRDRDLFKSILNVVHTHSNCLQSDLKGLLGEADGRRVATLVSYLEKAGKIARIKSGRTWRLLPPDSTEIPPPPPERIVTSHRAGGASASLREIDLSMLSYVPLPRAPLRWEEVGAGRQPEAVPEADDAFEVRDADWRIGPVTAIPMAERPDTAFRQLHPTDAGLMMIDDLGKAEGLGPIAAAAISYDRAGRQAARKALLHDVYRVGVHPLGCGIAAMSRGCVLHAYDDQLDLILETSLADAPEIGALRKRFEIRDDALKNHIRCVALSRGAERYLFTAVDEAWCVDRRGEALWGAKLPTSEGWTRVAAPSGEFGTSADVQRSLALMSLALPLTPEQLKARYRELAKQWHPDLNPTDPQASQKMQALTSAAEVLTGVEASALGRYAGATFVRELSREVIEAGDLNFTMTVGLQVGELHASDWIYAASFAANSDGVFLAGYSGRVVRVDEKGTAIRVYDIGSVPRRIVDTGDYLYLLTDTRLYVLRDDALHALIDIFDGGDLIVAQTGFGLIEKKRLRWFSEDGRYLGSVVSKDPIRRVYDTGAGMVVESRQRRVVVEGVPPWWS